MKNRFLKCNKQRLTTAAVLILLWGVFLFSATIFVDATQTANPPPCEQRTVPDCTDDGKKPEPGLICPNPRTHCPLDTIGESEDNNSIGEKQ